MRLPEVPSARATAAPPAPAPSSPPPLVELEPITPMNPLLPLVGLLCLIIFIQAIALSWHALWHPPLTWEQLHRQDIIDLKSQAETLAKRGQPADAYERFSDLNRQVAGNPVNDPDLKAALQTAQDEQAQMVHLILRQALAKAAIAPRPQAVVTPPPPMATTAPVVVVTPAPLPVRLRHPAVHPVAPEAAAAVDDERIGRAIADGSQYLVTRFAQDRIHNSSPYSDDGTDALAVYALLQAYNATGDSRLDPRRPFMKAALDTLKSLPMSDSQATYGRSLRANALSLAGRSEDREALQADLQWLLATGPRGTYTYPTHMLDRTSNLTNWIWDNSNSQYGLLGVWAAAEAGLAVPPSYWQAAQQHWVTTQLADGEWAYSPGDQDARRSMALAGLASLLVTQDYLRDAATGAAATPPALNKAMDWLEAGDNAVVPFGDPYFPGYAMFGLERVGLASGFKYFGKHDWYRESAADIVAAAQPDGGWGDEIPTCFALLFLARGRHPLIMSKLRYDGDWNDHPRDLANLARYAGRTIEQQLNWQVVPLNRDWTDWTDSPILYITGHDPPALDATDELKLRQFVLNGGLILTEADGGSATFTRWATDLGSRLFAPYQWQQPPPDHPLWNVLLRFKETPNLQVISNGARLLMVHLPDDVARYWQARAEADHPDKFALGLDLFLYATGRTDLRNRIVSTAIAPVEEPAAASIAMTQLDVAPDSDPEPAAWGRFANWFRRQTDLGLELPRQPLELLTPEQSPLAHLTGVNGFKATDAQCMALRLYVQAGGIVLIDPCGGPNDFLRSVRDDLLPRAFLSAPLTRLDGGYPLLTSSGDGMSQLWPLQVREYVRGLATPIDRGLWVLRSGKGAVVLSSLDITSGLLGCNTWGIAGFTPEYSLALAKNFVLWGWDGGKE
jgi:hypothetical protein